MFCRFTVEPDLQAGAIAVPPPMVHFAVLVHKKGMNVGNAAVQHILHKRAEPAVAAAADDQYFLAQGQKLA